MRKFEITVRDSFLKKEFAEVFEAETKEDAEQEAREIYAEQLDTFEDEVEIVSIKELEA